MNVLITGGAGSGGSYLCDYILANHPECKIYIPMRWHSDSALRNIKHLKCKIEIRECDLNDLPSIVRLLQECKPDKIFNMAATANVAVAFKTPLAVLQNNIFSTVNLLEAVRMVCPDTTFVHCSTSEVCGTPKEIPITEEHPLNPSNPYAISKLTTEKLAVCYFNTWGIKVIISRAFCYCNPRRHDLFMTAFAMQVARIEAGQQQVLIHGNLESERTAIDVREMSEAYWIASEKCEPGTPYNIGGIHPFKVGIVYQILKYKAKVPIIHSQESHLMRASDITHQIPDVSKFQKQTGWIPKISLNDSLDWLLEYCREYVRNEK